MLLIDDFEVYLTLIYLGTLLSSSDNAAHVPGAR